MPIRYRQDLSSATLLKSVADIENILSMIDVNPNEARAHSIEGFRWFFRWGSARIEVTVIEREASGYFQVFSPLMTLPETGLEAFFRALLSHNLEMTSAALALHEDIVYVFSERPIEGMDTEEARYIITHVASYADDLDNYLVNNYGGTLYDDVVDNTDVDVSDQGVAS
jgi:hypothetical protein